LRKEIEQNRSSTVKEKLNTFGKAFGQPTMIIVAAGLLLEIPLLVPACNQVFKAITYPTHLVAFSLSGLELISQ
jgi:hypothetical protein